MAMIKYMHETKNVELRGVWGKGVWGVKMIEVCYVHVRIYQNET